MTAPARRPAGRGQWAGAVERLRARPGARRHGGRGGDRVRRRLGGLPGNGGGERSAALLGLLTATGVLIVGLAALTGDMSAFTIDPLDVRDLPQHRPAGGGHRRSRDRAGLARRRARHSSPVWAAYRGRDAGRGRDGGRRRARRFPARRPGRGAVVGAARFVVTLGVLLVVASRLHYSDLEPLVGTSTAIRRNCSGGDRRSSACRRPARRPWRGSLRPARRSTCAGSSSPTSCVSPTRTHWPSPLG